MRRHLVHGIAGSLCALGLFAAPSPSEAVTITSVSVTVASSNKSVTYCDTTQGCVNKIWDLGGGKVLGAGNTLILTQTGTFPGVGGNFDTSDRADAGGTLACTAADPCRVTIVINGTTVFDSSAGNPINAGNAEPNPIPSSVFNEAADWVTVFSGSSFTLALGYADNEHTAPCADADGDCLPQANFSASGATFFIGTPLTNQGPCVSNCFDAGALLITGVGLPPANITVTQGGWGAPPHGNNPGALLKNNFASVYPTGVTIGCAFPNHLTFTSAAQIQAFLPQGGTPAALPKLSVFAGQVLALQLNVDFSAAGVLPTGLGGLHLASGPLAGKTVSFVLAFANAVLGGCQSLPANGVTSISQLNDIVDAINENFDGGNNGFLVP